MRGAIAVILLAGACSAAAQEADKTLMGMRLGIDKLSDVLSRIGNTPMPPRGELAPDELCYAAENPFESTWVVFGSGARGNWEILTHFRVLSSAPAGLTCRPEQPDERRNRTPSRILRSSTPDPARAQCEPMVLPGAVPAGVAGAEARADCADPPASSSRFTSPFNSPPSATMSLP